MAEERSTGVVQWFSYSKGFGFIKPDDGGEDLFVHQSSIRSEGYRSLVEGDRVEFVIVSGDNDKTKAIDVTGPNGAPLQSKKDNYDGRDGGYSFSGGWRGGDRRNSGGASGAGCYQCGDVGHLARDCNRGNNAGGPSCFKCGEVGHLARDCSLGNNGGGGACFRCHEYGHMARDCTRGGHMARDCTRGSGGGGGGCFTCGEVGHLARDCNKGSGRHGGSGGTQGNACFNCGKRGHFARDCPDVS